LERILRYIEQTYKPLSVIVYGSYASGTNQIDSDFDALVITENGDAYHDTSTVDGVPLDVFVHPAADFNGEFDCEKLIRLFDGRILTDTDGIGRALMEKVQAYLQGRPHKSEAELKSNLDWCAKMCNRARRQDAEGLYRRHWLLVDSLEIYFDILRQPYFGPKKSLIRMEQTSPEAFALYQRALRDFDEASLKAWIAHLSELYGNMNRPDP